MQYSPRFTELVYADNDEILTRLFVARIAEHFIGDALGEKQRPLGIDVHDVIVAFLGHGQQIGPHLGRDTGDVDQNVDAAVFLQCGIHKACPVIGHADISGNIGEVTAQWSIHFGPPGQPHHGDAVFQQDFRTGVSDAAGDPGDKCNFFHITFLRPAFCAAADKCPGPEPRIRGCLRAHA